MLFEDAFSLRILLATATTIASSTLAIQLPVASRLPALALLQQIARSLSATARRARASLAAAFATIPTW